MEIFTAVREKHGQVENLSDVCIRIDRERYAVTSFEDAELVRRYSADEDHFASDAVIKLLKEGRLIKLS